MRRFEILGKNNRNGIGEMHPRRHKIFLLPAIDNYYWELEQVQRNEGMRSCGMVAQTLMLAAKAMGYDSCPMDGFDFEAVGKLINLPEDHVIAMFVAIGKALSPAHPRGGQLALSEVIIQNQFWLGWYPCLVEKHVKLKTEKKDLHQIP